VRHATVTNAAREPTWRARPGQLRRGKMDMLGDLAMEGDEEFPELSEDKDDVLECAS
jgi:hypothetical protein